MSDIPSLPTPWRKHPANPEATPTPEKHRRGFQSSSDPKSRRRAGGWQAKKAGESAEQLFLKTGDLYLSQARAELRKRPEPYRRVGAALANGQFTAAPIAKSGPDFDLILPDGRSGLLELKSRRAKRIPLRSVGPAQQAALQRRVEWRGFGAVVVMLWSFESPARWWVVDWRAWHRGLDAGINSWRDTDLDEVGVSCELLLGDLPDFLPALLSAAEAAERLK